MNAQSKTSPIEQGADIIRSYVKKLPDTPGVYRMLSEKGEALYVGKAKSLKKRVVSYTRPDKLPFRLQRMIAATRTMEFVHTHTEAEALLRSARAFLFEAVEEAWDAASTTGEITVGHRRDVRLACTHAARSGARAVDLMYTLAGGTSVYRTSPLQRIFRDAHVATQHMMVAAPTLELAGRLFLDVPTDTALL